MLNKTRPVGLHAVARAVLRSSHIQSEAHLVNLLLLVDTELTRTHVDQEEKATDNREDLEEIVLSEVLVGVVVVQL